MSRPVSATISSINPSTVTAGTTNFTLTVTGSGFIVNSVQVNGSNRPTTFFSPLNFVLGTTQPFRVQSSSSLGAPLSVLNLALTHPRDGTVAMLGQELNAQAVLGGTGTGTVIGRQRIEFLSLFVDQVTCMHSCRRTAR